MKTIVLIAVALISGCSLVQPKSQQTSQFCATLDETNQFARCETSEVICYMTKTGNVCFGKPAPAPKQEEPKKIETKK